VTKIKHRISQSKWIQINLLFYRDIGPETYKIVLSGKIALIFKLFQIMQQNVREKSSKQIQYKV